MNHSEILSRVDHTLLSQTATWEEIRALCDDAMRYHTASVCIPPCYVKQAKDYVKDRMAVCTVVGFPNGYSTTASKVFETREALENGADEIDIVLALNSFLAGDLASAAAEIVEMRKAVDEEGEAFGKKIVLKVILETGLLSTPELIASASLLAMESGADFIKTSTGKVEVNATPEAAYVMCSCIRLFHEKTGRKVGFKAAGGISTAEDALYYYRIVESVLGSGWLGSEYFRLGVSRLGNSLLSAIEKKEIKYF